MNETQVKAMLQGVKYNTDRDHVIIILLLDTYLRTSGLCSLKMEDVNLLQEILGHSTMEVVNNYLAIAPVDMDTAHKKAGPMDGWRL